MTRPAVRVLHVAQPTDYGVARYLGDLVAGQVAAGWEVSVACPADGSLPAAIAERGARHLPWSARRGPGLHVAMEIARIRRIVDLARPDIVHLHSSTAGLAGRAAWRGSRPTIFQPHAWSFLTGPAVLRRLARRWERHAARWCDAIVCGSRAEQQRGVRAGIDARWHVVANAIDVSRFPFVGALERESTRRRLGFDGDPLVVCVGRLCRQKGQDVLLDAWPAVRAAVPAARLVLVGDGPDRPHIERRRCTGVHIAGHHDDVRPWLSAADVAVQPSRYETLSLAMLEAMATGRSVVAADIEGAREALRPYDGAAAGALVTPDDPAGLAVSLIRRLRQPQLAQAEGRVGRQRVEAKYHTGVVTAGIEAVVDDVLSRPRRAGRSSPDHSTWKRDN